MSTSDAVLLFHWQDVHRCRLYRGSRKMPRYPVLMTQPGQKSQVYFVPASNITSNVHGCQLITISYGCTNHT